MNWLAHIFLSPDDAEYRIGNVLADWVKGEARLQLSAGIQRGIACHKVIDAYTDAHPITRQSMARIEAPFKRYAGVLIDVFYDHILAQDWSRYCNMPLHEWTQGVYAQFRSHARDLHPELRMGLLRMAEDDWLGSYATVEGIDAILKRMSRRLSRPNLLGEATPQLTAHLAGIREDFHVFFPQLQAHVQEWQADESKPPKALGAL
jgi:acyl carrier protein phosphodiesterase